MPNTKRTEKPSSPHRPAQSNTGRRTRRGDDVPRHETGAGARFGTFEQDVKREGDDIRTRDTTPDNLMPATERSTPDR
jgi:hypothetical protein